MTKTSSRLSRPAVVCLLAGICCALWGSAFPCIKLGYGLFAIDTHHTPSIILFAGMRFFLAGALVIAIGSVLRQKLLRPRCGRTWRRAVVLSLFQTVLQYLFFYIGLSHTTGVKASIINSSSVFLALLIAALLFRQETLTGRKLLGCAIGFAGVVLVNLGQGSIGGSFSWMGEGFILLSSLSYAFSSVFLKRFSREDDPVLLSGWQFLAGGAFMMLWGRAGGGHLGAVSPAALGMLLYLALISAVAYSLWGILLKYNPVSRVAVFGFMTPVFGVVLSALLLREGSQAGGLCSAAALVLVCTGIYLVNRSTAVPAGKERASHDL